MRGYFHYGVIYLQKIKLVDKPRKKNDGATIAAAPDNVKLAYQKTKNIYSKSIEQNKSSEEYINEILDDIVSDSTDVVHSNAKKTIVSVIQKRRNVKQAEITNIQITNAQNVTNTTVVERAKKSVINKNIKENTKTSAQFIVQSIKNVFVPVVSKATVKVKVGIDATKAALLSLIAESGIGVLMVIIVCITGLVCGSSFGILMATEDTGTGYTLQTVINDINAEYFAEIESIKASVSYDDFEIIGKKPNWKNILAVYAIKATTEAEGFEVITVTEEKIEMIRKVFWDMTEIFYETETYEDIDVIETIDKQGNTIVQEVTVTKMRLVIDIQNKTTAEAAIEYEFDEIQSAQLQELIRNMNL